MRLRAPLPFWIDPLTATHLQDVLTTLLERHGEHLLAIILYGSLARQEERPPDHPKPSDVDLLLILDTDEAIAPEEYSAIFHSLGLAHLRHLDGPREISPMLTTRTLAEWDPALVANVARDGIILYAHGPLPAPFAHLRRLLTEDVSELRTQEATKRVGHFCPHPSGCEATSTMAESASNR